MDTIRQSPSNPETQVKSTCPMGHGVEAGDSFCSVCGEAIRSTEHGDKDNPAADAHRNSTLLGKFGKAKFRHILAGIGIVATLAVGVRLASTNDSDNSVPQTEGAAVGIVECTTRIEHLPQGTDLLSIEVKENHPDRIWLSAKFDGAVPPAATNAQYTLLLELLLFVNRQDTTPYRVVVTSLFGPYGVQAGRIGHGFIDSSGFDLTVDRDTIDVVFDPSVFTQLPAGERFGLGAQTVVQELRNGFYQGIAEQKCNIG